MLRLSAKMPCNDFWWKRPYLCIKALFMISPWMPPWSASSVRVLYQNHHLSTSRRWRHRWTAQLLSQSHWSVWPGLHNTHRLPALLTAAKRPLEIAWSFARLPRRRVNRLLVAFRQSSLRKRSDFASRWLCAPRCIYESGYSRYSSFHTVSWIRLWSCANSRQIVTRLSAYYRANRISRWSASICPSCFWKLKVLRLWSVC